MGPKHSVRDKFKEMHFLADIDQLLVQLKTDSASSDSLDEVESAAHWYIKRIKRTPLDLAVERVGMCLRDHELLAVLFDKGVGVAVMKADTYWRNLSEVLASNLLQPVDCNDDIVIKLERSLNRELLLLKKKGKLPAGVYENLRFTGSQPARLYGLAKVHKQNVPLRPVLSLPGSHYESLNKWLAQFFCSRRGSQH